MIKSGTEEMRKFCAAFLSEESQPERDEIIEKLEDCIDFVSAIQCINETYESGDVSDWEDFEKELDEDEGIGS
jgi:hypothetical protein